MVLSAPAHLRNNNNNNNTSDNHNNDNYHKDSDNIDHVITEAVFTGLQLELKLSSYLSCSLCVSIIVVS